MMWRQPLLWVLVLLSALTVVMAYFYLGQDRLFEYSKDIPEIIHLVDQAYVDEVNMSQLMGGAFQGALERLDENASFIPPGEAPEPLGDKVFQLTGLVLAKRNGYGYVLAVAEESPAANAGIRPGVYIREIRGASTHLMSLYQLRKQLTQPLDLLRLTLVDPDGTDDFAVELHPGRFEGRPLRVTSYGDGLHLLGISRFYPGLPKDLKKALNKIGSQGGPLVLDLRNNALGTTRDLLVLAAFFLPAGKLASWTNAQQESVDIVNPKAGKFSKQPFYILLDTSTSGAAEAFSAIAQETGLAKVVGKPSLGNPGRYQFIPLKNGGFVEISTHHLRLKSGKNLTRAGITPDISLKTGGADSSPSHFLDKALEQIRRTPLKKAS